MSSKIRENLVSVLIALGIFGAVAAQMYVDGLSDEKAQNLNDSIEDGKLMEMKVAGPGSQHIIC